MKRTLLIVVSVLVLGGLVAWSQRFALALDHLRARAVDGAAPSSTAWSILDDFADRPELEAFVRERLAAISAAALDNQLPVGSDPAPLLKLTSQVYERQPERMDAAVAAAALIVECLIRCGRSQGISAPPAFASSAWTAEAQGSDAFREGMRSAAIALAKYVPGTGSYSRSESYAALVTAVAAGVASPDSELAAAVAGFAITENPDFANLRWLSAAIERLAGSPGAGAAWTMALSRVPAADPSDEVWERIVETLRRSPAPLDHTLADVMVSHCARRSQRPAGIDEACIDLGLTWGGAWAARLRTAAAAEEGDEGAARALLAAHERARTRTWQNVIADWRRTSSAPGSARTSATWEYSAPSERRRVRETALLLAAGAPAFPAVAALYRTSGDPEIINDAAFVLSEGSPQLLSSAVMDRIEQFRLTAAPVGEEDLGTDPGTDLRTKLETKLRIDLGIDLGIDLESDLGVDLGSEPIYDRLEARRVATGLLALKGEGRASTRIHPLILALSIPIAEFSEHASDALRQTLDASGFADALFGFLAIRERYLVSEVNVYRNALVSYHGVGPAIERNLAQLIADARGIPEQVPWILKVIGIPALGETGGASACPLLERYAEDSGSYLQIDGPAGNRFARSRAAKKRFDELAARALDRITECGA